jgi:solute carrier family 13 (sodium-dependent dicarboxylate transporter), member 2/3/5
MNFIKIHFKTLAICLGFVLFGIIYFGNQIGFYFNPEGFYDPKGEKIYAAMALGGLMIYFWILEVIPIYVTALFPLIFAPMLGLLVPAELASSYGNEMVYLFLGGFILALALEKWGIHILIAQAIMDTIGYSKPRLMLGIILSTGFLSMWVSNTATTLMMLPLAIAVIEALPVNDRKGKFPVYLLLGVSYAASIGGMGTLIGSPTNTQMALILASDGVEVDFLTWMKYGMPAALCLLGLLYLYFWIGLGKTERAGHVNKLKIDDITWDKNRLAVASIFLIVVLFWSFKEVFKNYGLVYSDASVALAGAAIMFIIPSKSHKTNLLIWSDTEKLPWGVLLLFGGGMALAKILENGGVIAAIATSFKSIDYLNEKTYGAYVLLLVIVVTLAIFVTEVMSNLALVIILIPIIMKVAETMNYPVLQLCLPVTLAASCAFMLPVGTPPNAIVFSSGYIKIKEMARVGFVMNIIGVIFIVLFALIFIK